MEIQIFAYTATVFTDCKHFLQFKYSSDGVSQQTGGLLFASTVAADDVPLAVTFPRLSLLTALQITLISIVMVQLQEDGRISLEGSGFNILSRTLCPEAEDSYGPFVSLLRAARPKRILPNEST